MTETTKPKAEKAAPSVYVCHSETWSTVVLFSQKLGGMQYALDNGLRFLTAPYGVNLRAKPEPKSTVTPITPREGNA